MNKEYPQIGVYLDDRRLTTVWFRHRWQATLFHMLLNDSVSDHIGTVDA